MGLFCGAEATQSGGLQRPEVPSEMWFEPCGARYAKSWLWSMLSPEWRMGLVASLQTAPRGPRKVPYRVCDGPKRYTVQLGQVPPVRAWERVRTSMGTLPLPVVSVFVGGAALLWWGLIGLYAASVDRSCPAAGSWKPMASIVPLQYWNQVWAYHSVYMGPRRMVFSQSICPLVSGYPLGRQVVAANSLRMFVVAAVLEHPFYRWGRHAAAMCGEKVRSLLAPQSVHLDPLRVPVPVPVPVPCPVPVPEFDPFPEIVDPNPVPDPDPNPNQEQR